MLLTHFFINNNVLVGEIMPMHLGKTFNFADNEQNYFAVAERSSK